LKEKKSQKKIEGNFVFTSDRRNVDLSMAEGSLSALNWPLSRCNVTTRLDVKALRDFPVLCLSNCRNAKFAFGQFNGPDLLVI
jgi:hypothetical protein